MTVKPIAVARVPVRAPARHALAILAGALVAAGALAPHAHAAATLGFVENWPGVSVSSWGGGTPISNPGTGGTLGAGDGYLLVSSAFVAHLGTHSEGPEYAGNWTAAGITRVNVWLNDVNAPDPLEVHVSVGRHPFSLDPGNFWQYNVGFIPPSGVWKEFVVDLSSPANWTQIIGSGTFANALATVNTVLIRHDQAPYTQSPDLIPGDYGMDHLQLTNSVVGVDPLERVAVGRAVELAPPAPNPSRGPVEFSMVNPSGEALRLQIVDAGGRLVRRAELPAGNAGTRIWTWDGADDHGRQVAPGYYRARAFGPSGGTSRPLIRVR
jgi:hypothetical protein